MREIQQYPLTLRSEDEMSMTNYQPGTESSVTTEPMNASSESGQIASRFPTTPQETPQGGNGSFPNRLAVEMAQFTKVLTAMRSGLTPAMGFEDRCQQAFNLANDLFGNAPTWICFYREMLGGNGIIHELFPERGDFGRFLRTEQYHQIQLMLTALRSRELPENDPNDPQRMITVRLPKSLHEAMCDEAARLNISVNRLCISRMLQLLDPKMIPETQSKPRGRKPRLGNPMPASAANRSPVDACGNGESASTTGMPTAQSPTTRSLGSSSNFPGGSTTNW
jgi:hypothetical protein